MPTLPTARNIAWYPWFKFFQSLLFWQAVWFLFFQSRLSAAEAILLYAIYDIGTIILEVPSGYMSDKLGRRFTLIASAIAALIGAVLLSVGDSFAVFALAQVFLGASGAFTSGTDSALLYESLAANGQQDDVEKQELRAWRFSFSALAISAVLGGLLALQSEVLPFVASAAAAAVALVVAFRFVSLPEAVGQHAEGAEILQLDAMKAALRQPVLNWLLLLGVAMYIFSHLPFIFGQPFIADALAARGLEHDAPLVSGLVTALMMVLSVAASLFARRLRHKLGLPALLLLAFAMQITLAGVLALTNQALAIAFLFFRMVPDALSKPFVIARIQPLLGDQARATYLSLRSLCARLVFAATLYMASLSTSHQGQMPYRDIQLVLGWYVLGGVACLVALATLTRRIRVDDKTTG